MATEANPLIPMIERVVPFYGEPITVALLESSAYVPLRAMTDTLGLPWPPQYQRLQRDPILSRHIHTLEVTGADGRRREAVCLELEYLPGWLFGINASRVREDRKDKLLRYQEHCFRVLWQAVQAEIAPPPQAPAAPLEQVRGLALAIATLAEQQMQMENRVSEVHELAKSAHQRLDRAAEAVGALQRRLSPAAVITDEQAAEISNQVKALAQLLTERDPSKNHYQGIFSQLYREFGVSSYKLIRQDRYEQVLAFLEDWRWRSGGAV